MAEDEPKQCAVCEQERPQSEYYRYPNGSLYAHCKRCHRDRVYATREKRLGRTIQSRDPLATTKQCSRCAQWFPIEDFPLKSKATGWRRSFCVACKNAANQDYKQRNQVKVQESNAQYRAANKAELAERERQWRLDHPKRAKEIVSASHEKHVEQRREYNREYTKAHLEQSNARWSARRARKLGNGGSHTAEEWRILKATYDHRCLSCDKQEPDIKLTKDHVISIDAGGPDSIENIQPLCQRCNSRKSRGIVDFRQRS